VKELLSQYVLVQLYTDVIPQKYQPTTSTEENKEFMQSHFGTLELPLYVILKPEGGRWELIDKTGGKINSVESFKDFLRKPLEANRVAKRD